MIRSIYTRDKAGTSDPALAEFVADQELKFGDQVPTGTYLDMTAHLPVVDPTKVLSPVLLIRGEYDGIATVEDLLDFYKQLPSRRSPIRDPAGHGTLGCFRIKPEAVLALHARISDRPNRARVIRATSSSS